MARGSRLSGSMEKDELELSLNTSSSEMEFDSAPLKQAENKLSFPQRVEVFLQHLVSRAGFFGILLCASVISHFG